jgi:hypothetical protein
MTAGSDPVPYPCLAAIAKIMGAVAPLSVESDAGGHYGCPLCDGEGTIDDELVATYGGKPAEFPIGVVGVQVYGIGEGHLDLGTALNGMPAEYAALMTAHAAEIARLVGENAVNLADAQAMRSLRSNIRSDCTDFKERPGDSFNISLMQYIGKLQAALDSAGG